MLRVLLTTALSVAGGAGCGRGADPTTTSSPANGAGAAQAEPAEAAQAEPADGPAVVRRRTGGAPIALSAIAEQLQAENDAMQRVYNRRGPAARQLSRMNAMLQKQGYFLRIPSQPSVESLESQLRALAAAHPPLIIQGIGVEVIRGDPVEPVTLGPGERWSPTAEELLGELRLEIDLHGKPQELVGFIDDLPARVERLIVLENLQREQDNYRITARAWFERAMPAPKVTLRWPPLAARLLEAGWDPEDPALRADPAWPTVQKLHDQGRARTPEVRAAVTITADFPRWLLRVREFEALSLRAASVSGASFLGLSTSGAGHGIE
jgi:hypothetical protein